MIEQKYPELPSADSGDNNTIADVIGNKTDTASGDSLLALLKQVLADTIKIDEASVDGLAGTSNSLAYRVHEIEKHFHNDEKVYGNTANAMAADIPIKFTVIGGDNAWGTELMLTDGTVIESGSGTKKFDLDTLFIVSASAANKISVLEILASPINTGVACTFDFTAGTVEDMVEAVGHGFENGDKLVFEDGAGSLPAEILEYNVYYVVNKSTDYFQVSLTSGGAVFPFTDDGGACFFFPINAAGVAQGAVVQSSCTKTILSFAAQNSDSYPFPVKNARIPCNYRLFIRAKSETGSTISIGFLMGLHTYDS